MKKLLIAAALLLSSCSSNEMVRKFSGKQTIHLKPNEVLLNVSWKEFDMWILTEDTTTGKKYFRENSSLGIMNGEVTIEESKNGNKH